MEIPPGNPQFLIYPEGTDKFFAKWGEFFLNFERDKKEKVSQLIIAREGDRVRYIKIK